MLLWILLSAALAGVIAAVYFVKTARPVDTVRLVFRVLWKLGFFGFIQFFGLRKFLRPRPKATGRYKAENGFEIVTPNALFWTVVNPSLRLKTRDDDVFVATYPKSGTTWTQEMAWLICNNADVEAAKRTTLSSRSPFLETIDAIDDYKGLHSLECWPENSQRVVKTHLPYELLPEELTAGKKGKIIWVVRNPKDAAVSYYHFHRCYSGLPEPGTWSEFLTKFCSGEVAWGDWFTHTMKFWEEYQKNKDQIYFTTFEQMKRDTRSEVVAIAKFLKKELTADQIDAITKHCSFESMSTNKQTNYEKAQKFGMDFNRSKFMRKGQVGDWKNHFTLNENAAFDVMYEAKMKGSGLEVEFEI